MNTTRMTTHRVTLGGRDLSPYIARQAAEVETRLQSYAALVGKPLDVVRDQVRELAQVSRRPSVQIVDQLEYRHHYRQAKRLGELASRPKLPADRRTLTIWGQPYYLLQPLGRPMTLKPGYAPW